MIKYIFIWFVEAKILSIFQISIENILGECHEGVKEITSNTSHHII